MPTLSRVVSNEAFAKLAIEKEKVLRRGARLSSKTTSKQSDKASLTISSVEVPNQRQRNQSQTIKTSLMRIRKVNHAALCTLCFFFFASSIYGFAGNATIVYAPQTAEFSRVFQFTGLRTLEEIVETVAGILALAHS